MSSKTSYNLIYDLLARLYTSLNRLMASKGHQKQEKREALLKETAPILNNVAVLNHLLASTKDLKLAFLQKERATILEEQIESVRKYGLVVPKVDLDMMYCGEDRSEHLWVFKNKILDEIQLVPFEQSEL